MNKIEISLNESEETVISLSYMMNNIKYRKQYCDFLTDNKLEFPHPTLEILSNLLIRNKNKTDMLLDYKVLKQVNEIGYLTTVLDNAYFKINEAITISFLEKIKGEKERITPLKYTNEFKNCKKAFMSFCSGKIKVIINNKNNDSPFMMKSVNNEWLPVSSDYMMVIYNKFIECCESELDILRHNMEILKGSIDDEEYSEMKKDYDERCDLVDLWDTSSSAIESINKIKRNEQFIDFNFNKEKNISKESNLEH